MCQFKKGQAVIPAENHQFHPPHPPTAPPMCFHLRIMQHLKMKDKLRRAKNGGMWGGGCDLMWDQ